jgi:hypothetical protein
MFYEFKADLIKNVDVVIIDGTFKTTPPGFFQTIIIHGFVFGKSLPFVYSIVKKTKLTNI